MLQKITVNLWRGFWPFIVAVLLVWLGAELYWHHEVKHPSTSDAVLYNDVVPISPNISGMVTAVYVHIDQHVQTGEVLFSIDPRPYELALKQAQNQLIQAKQDVLEEQAAVLTAQAHLASAQAALTLAQAQYHRKAMLFKTGGLSPSDLDVSRQVLVSAQAQVQVAKAGVASAQAQLGDPNHSVAVVSAELKVDQAQLDLSDTRVKAPAAGYITNFNLTPGQRVQVGEILSGIVENKAWRVHADILEPFLTRIRVGQSVRLKIGMYPDKVYQGVVSGVGYGIDIAGWQAHQALSQVASSYDWISVVKRFPVIITITSSHDQRETPFRVGASVSVSIDTTRSGVGS